MKNVMITVSNTELLDEIVFELEKLDIIDISILSSASVNRNMAKNKKTISFIGSFRKFLDLYYEDEKIIMTIVEKEKIELIREAIKEKLQGNIKYIKIIASDFEEVLGVK